MFLHPKHVLWNISVHKEPEQERHQQQQQQPDEPYLFITISKTTFANDISGSSDGVKYIQLTTLILRWLNVINHDLNLTEANSNSNQTTSTSFMAGNFFLSLSYFSRLERGNNPKELNLDTIPPQTDYCLDCSFVSGVNRWSHLSSIVTNFTTIGCSINKDWIETSSGCFSCFIVRFVLT